MPGDEMNCNYGREINFWRWLTGICLSAVVFVVYKFFPFPVAVAIAFSAAALGTVICAFYIPAVYGGFAVKTDAERIFIKKGVFIKKQIIINRRSLVFWETLRLPILSLFGLELPVIKSGAAVFILPAMSRRRAEEIKNAVFR